MHSKKKTSLLITVYQILRNISFFLNDYETSFFFYSYVQIQCDVFFFLIQSKFSKNFSIKWVNDSWIHLGPVFRVISFWLPISFHWNTKYEIDSIYWLIDDHWPREIFQPFYYLFCHHSNLWCRLCIHQKNITTSQLHTAETIEANAP